MRTREQTYAETIYSQVEAVAREDFRGDYKNAAKNLPVLIRTAGLVQALYFAKTRNDGSERLINDLSTAVGCPRLLDDARTKPINEYIWLTEKCLGALKWYKRFVDVHIDD